MANTYDIKKIGRPSKPRSKKLQGVYDRGATISILSSQGAVGNSSSPDAGGVSTSSSDKLSKVSDDTAQGRITLAGGAYTDDISSASFVSGFAGSGYQIKEDDGKYNAEFDNVTVRGSMSVYELIIQQIKSVGGTLVVSAANGKISEVELNGTVYKISFAEEHQFTAGDLIRCQKYTGTDIRSYWITVGAVGSDFLYVNESEFGGVVPLVGDELVQFGHVSDTDSQGFVYISAIDDGAPKVDIYDGVDSKSLTGKLRGRYGDLSGVVDPRFPDISGYGIYSDNAYFTDGNFNGIISTTMKDAPPATITEQDIVENTGSTFINVVTSGGFIVDAGQLQFDAKYIGMPVTIANTYYNDNGTPVLSQGSYTFHAPPGKYFFENGVKKSSVTLGRETVSFLGYGSDNLFYGWIVTNRVDVVTEGRYGERDLVMFQGLYDYSASSVKFKSYDPDVRLKVTRLRTGEYQVNFVNTSDTVISIGTSEYLVQGTCPIPQISGERTRIFNYFNVTDTGFRIALYQQTDDRLDGDFNFRVISTRGWETNI